MPPIHRQSVKARPKTTNSKTRKAPKKPVNVEVNSNAESLLYANTVFRYVKTASFSSPEGPLKAVILDNDETTGVFDRLRDAVNTYNNEQPYAEFITNTAQTLLESGFRPGIQKFLQTLRDLKTTGRINAVIMYTNMSRKPLFKATDQDRFITRPEILSDIFDELLGSHQQPLMDLIIFRNIPFPPFKFMAVIETIYGVEGRGNKYVFLDDKPENIMNTNTSTEPSVHAYGITEYKGRPTNKNFNSAYNAKGVVNKTVYDLLNEVFP